MIRPDDLLTVQEAADELGCGKRQVQRLCNSGQLAATRPNGPYVISRLAVWRYKGIAAEMLAEFQAYLRGRDTLNSD